MSPDLTPWTTEEKHLLEGLYKAGFSYKEIAQRLPGRTIDAIRSARIYLRIKSRGRYSGRMQLPEPVRTKLIKMYYDGCARKEMAFCAGKTVGAVTSLISRWKKAQERQTASCSSSIDHPASQEGNIVRS